jgi:hypothetical protein
MMGKESGAYVSGVLDTLLLMRYASGFDEIAREALQQAGITARELEPFREAYDHIEAYGGFISRLQGLV